MEEKLFGKELIKETTNEEGNIELSFKSRNRVAMQALATGGFLMFFVYISIAFYFTDSFWFSLIIAIGLTFAFWYFLSKTRDKITIIKNKGIKFLRQELPFSSVDEYFINQTSWTSKSRNQTNLWHVSARVRGRNIVITRDMPENLARAVLEKIIVHSKSA